MKKILFIVMILSCFMISLSEALIIVESEPNDVLEIAQSIDNYFSVGVNGDINQSTVLPWVSISGTGNGTYDWFSFSVIAGAFGYFDIDYGFDGSDPLNSYVRLYNSSNSLLAAAGDSDHIIDAGSVSDKDSLFGFNFFADGVYYLKVSHFYDLAIPVGSDYQLQVSIKNPKSAAPIPEPKTVGLFSLGLIGIGFIRKKFC